MPGRPGAAGPITLLVHGAGHGSWCWDELRPHLEGPTRIVDLPSVHADPLGDLDADTAAVRAALDAIEGDVVVVAHSYGAVPAAAAVAGDASVSHLVLLTAFALDAGESLLGAVGGEDPPWWWRDAGAGTEPASAAGWHDRPTTYVVCEDDEAIPPPAQEAMAARTGGQVVRLASSHSPFLSHPDEVAAIVAGGR